MFKYILLLSLLIHSLTTTISPSEDITNSDLGKNFEFITALRAIETDLTLRRKEKLIKIVQVIETRYVKAADYSFIGQTYTAEYLYLVSVVGMNATIKGVGKKIL